jgi:histone acetyltransferase 1
MEDVAERVEKLESAVDSQQEEFEERLEGLEKRQSLAADENSVPAAGARSKRKRAVVVEDDEDDEWEDMDEVSVASSKRMRS